MIIWLARVAITATIFSSFVLIVFGIGALIAWLATVLSGASYWFAVSAVIIIPVSMIMVTVDEISDSSSWSN